MLYCCNPYDRYYPIREIYDGQRLFTCAQYLECSVAKTRSHYNCSSCGYVSPRWLGKCPECNQWNTFVEELDAAEPSASKKAQRQKLAIGSTAERPLRLSEITAENEDRISSGIPELDRTIGGGIMRGSLILLGGDPGIGKSTLLLQLAKVTLGLEILYVSGEESVRQLKSRAERLGMKNEMISFYAETNIEEIIAQAEKMRPDILIVDSIQTMYHSGLSSIPGSVGQVRECASLLLQFAKQTAIPVFIVGHVTKEGMLAGPKVLEHIVDTVLQFEGEQRSNYRILRAIKNRFGSTNEIGVFSMTAEGLEEVPNPSQVFLAERMFGASGSAVACVLEGTRPMLLETQALVSPTSYHSPQHTVTGYDHRRVSMLLAVIEKRAGIRLSQHDVFVNIAGGITVNEPSIDLAICAAVISSARDIPLLSEMCFIGEVGLSGEIRSVPQIDLRIQEAMKLGFGSIVIPEKGSRDKQKSLIGIRTVHQLVDIVVKA